MSRENKNRLSQGSGKGVPKILRINMENTAYGCVKTCYTVREDLETAGLVDRQMDKIIELR